MFSSFKEKLNTGLTTLQEKGLSGSTTPSAGTASGSGQGSAIITTATTTPETGASVPSVHDQHVTSPVIPSPGSIASRMISGGGSALFRRPLQASTATRSAADLFSSALSSSITSSSSSSFTSNSTLVSTFHSRTSMDIAAAGGSMKLALLVQKLTLDPMEEKADPLRLEAVRQEFKASEAARKGVPTTLGAHRVSTDTTSTTSTTTTTATEAPDSEAPQEPVGAELSDSVVEKLEVLQRYEARFPDLASAFKKLVQEKVAVEAILKASTPLEDLSDVEALEAHLQNMANKSELSMQEIRRLSNELKDMSQRKESRDLEVISQAERIESLQDQLSEQTKEIERLQSTALESSGSTPVLEATLFTSVSAPDLLRPEPQQDSMFFNVDLSDPPQRPPPPQRAASASPVSSLKEKKNLSKETKKKDQALRELMIRLESVLKEKNQALEDQEEAESRVKELEADLEKMTEKMTRLQKQLVVEASAMTTHSTATAKSLVGSVTIDAVSSETMHTIGEDDDEEGDDEEDKETKQGRHRAEIEKLQQELVQVQSLVEQATRRESEAIRAKEIALMKESTALQLKLTAEKSFTQAQLAQSIAKDSALQAEKEVKIAKAQIRGLQQQTVVLEMTKKDLSMMKKEVQEVKQEAKEVREELDLVQLELMAARKEVEGVKEELKVAFADHEETKKALESVLEQATKEQNEAEGRVQERTLQLEEAKAEKEAVVEGLRKELGESKEERTRMEKKLQDMVQEIEGLEGKAKEYDVLLKSLQEKVIALEVSEAKAQEDQVAMVLRAEEEKQIAVKKTEAEKEDLAVRLCAVQKVKDEFQLRIVGLEQEKDDLVNRLQESSDRVETLVAEKTSIVQEWESKRMLKETEFERFTQPSHESSKSSESVPDQDSTSALQLRIAELEGEILALDQVPSKNALKKLRQELNQTKRAQQEAEESIVRLQVELELAQSRELVSDEDNTAAKESKVDVDRMLCELKERLIAQEQLVQEKDKALEARQRALEEVSRRFKDLERQMQQQQQQEEEEMKVVEIESPISILSVQQLEKERDDLAKKLADLEKLHHGTKRNSQDSLNALEQDIAALRYEKLELEGQVREKSLLLKDVQQKVSNEEEKVTLALEAVHKVEQLASSKVAEMLRDRDTVAERVKELEEQLVQAEGVKKEMEEKLMESVEVLKAQMEGLEGQAKVEMEKVVETLKREVDASQQEVKKLEQDMESVKVSHAQKMAKLSETMVSLTGEKASLLLQVSEAETRVRDAKAQAEESAKLLQAIEDENKRCIAAEAAAEEKIKGLEGQVKMLTMKDRDTKEALVLAKATLHQRDQDLEATRKIKTEDEEKVQKATNLVKATRKEVLRLEKEKQEAMEELETVKGHWIKAQQEVKTLTSQSLSQQTTHATELSRLQASYSKAVHDRDRILQDREGVQNQLQMKQAEVETFQGMVENAEQEMREYRHQLGEARDRVDTLEEVTSIAKRVAETKVGEVEGLRKKCLELEQGLEKVQGVLKTKVEVHKAEMENFMQEIEENKEVLGQEIADLAGLLKRREGEVEKLERVVEEMGREVEVLMGRKRDLELEVQHFKDLHAILTQEKESHEKTVEDVKMREGHLRTLNKTLQEELRKLQRQLPGGSGSSPLPSPTTPRGPFPNNNNHSSGPHTPGTPMPMGRSASNHGNGVTFSAPSTPTTSSFGQNIHPSHHRVVADGPKSSSLLGRSLTLAGTSSSVSTGSVNMMTPPSTPRFGRMASQPLMTPRGGHHDPESDFNNEYLKNVLLSFFEYKERRQQLVPVVSQVLGLSPEETKRLAKGV